MKDFMAGVRSLAIGWQVWLLALMAVNFFIPVYFISHLEAQLTIAAFFAGGMIGMVLVKVQGFTRLLGLMHILWIPLVIYLAGQLSVFPPDHLFDLWIRGVLILNGISLLIDFVDVLRYFRGERKPVTRGEIKPVGESA